MGVWAADTDQPEQWLTKEHALPASPIRERRGSWNYCSPHFGWADAFRMKLHVHWSYWHYLNGVKSLPFSSLNTPVQDQTQFSAYYWKLIFWEMTKIQCKKKPKTDTQGFFRPLIFTDSFSINFNLDANLIFAFWGSVNWNLCDLKHNIRAHFILHSYYRVDHININSIYQGLGNVLQKHLTQHFKESLDGGRS